MLQYNSVLRYVAILTTATLITCVMIAMETDTADAVKCFDCFQFE